MKVNQQDREEGTLLTLVKSGGFSNTCLIGTFTIRNLLTLILSVGIGFFLWKTPLFGRNWLAMLAYVAFCSLLFGTTPTGRNVLLHLYGILVRRPIHMLVHDQMTATTFRHGIAEVETDKPEIDAVPFRLAHTKQYALVYHITSGIGRWSSEGEKLREAGLIKSLFNILEGGESLMIALKQDSDTGMLKLKDMLKEQEKFEGDDLLALSKKREDLLQRAGTTAAGRSVQQYAILLVKPKNVHRVTQALKKCSRRTRPAEHPADVLLSVMGFEAGIERIEE